jgi:hypothetical protein
MVDNAPLGPTLGSKPSGVFFDRLQETKTMTVYVIADIKVTDDGWVPGEVAITDALNRSAVGACGEGLQPNCLIANVGFENLIV